jgi:hypothetical protein
MVEGHDDLFAVVGLIRAHVDWPQGKDSKKFAPVFIHNGNGAPEILKKEGYFAVLLKSPVVKAAGVVLDADGTAKGRYESIRGLCLGLFPQLPEVLPPDGLVVENDDHKRLGIWIMPDNASPGTLETFLKWLVPARNYAVNAVDAARKMGCSCRECHIEKANLYTWLSWQDPPGQSPGIALTQKVLDPLNSSAATFVEWFMKLYQLPPKAKLFS